jgi:hypothetical protein
MHSVKGWRSSPSRDLRSVNSDERFGRRRDIHG